MRDLELKKVWRTARRPVTRDLEPETVRRMARHRQRGNRSRRRSGDVGPGTGDDLVDGQTSGDVGVGTGAGLTDGQTFSD